MPWVRQISCAGRSRSCSFGNCEVTRQWIGGYDLRHANPIPRKDYRAYCTPLGLVQGIAQVTLGEQTVDLTVGQSHRLANFTSSMVEIVEVQFGDYLGEDDIVRA